VKKTIVLELLGGPKDGARVTVDSERTLERLKRALDDDGQAYKVEIKEESK
jgi:hypothetical protein